MPLTALQQDVLAVLAANRSEESHFAGGILLHTPQDSPRFSRDFFHDVAAEVVRASERDAASLRAAGFIVDTLSRRGEWDRDTTFRKAFVRGTDSDEALEIDWAADSSFRFFPIERDAQLGWRLHMFDAATNKALTLAARTETRDYVDIVELARRFPLSGICWAACGKDPGFTPLALKAEWVAMSDEAGSQMAAIADTRPDLPIGVAFVDASGAPGWIGNDPTLRLHPPSIRGCWPTVHGIESDLR